jgi:hypothetical protein
MTKEFFMPRCGATLNENNVTPWIRGDVKGVLGHEPTHPGAGSCEKIIQKGLD